MASPPDQSPPTVTSTTPRKKRLSRGADIALSVVFLTVQFIFVAVAFPLALIGSFYYFTSGAGPLASIAFPIYVFGPGFLFLVTLVVGLVFMITKRHAWILTLAGLFASVLSFFIGGGLGEVR